MIRISKLQGVILVGLAVRLVISPFLAHPFDVYAWYENGEGFLNGSIPLSSFLAPYSYAFFIFVFPATFAFQYLSSVLSLPAIPISSLSPLLNPGAPWNITVVPGVLFDFLVKIPLIASDTIIALIIYRLVMKYVRDERTALSALTLWYLNPLTIWVSSGWGMFDTLAALFTLLALWLLLGRRFFLAGASLALAASMKYYAVILIVPLALLAWKSERARGLVYSVAGVGGTGILMAIPLLSNTASYFVILTGGAVSQNLHYSGLTFWTAVTLFYSSFNQSVISAALVTFTLVVLYITFASKMARPDFIASAVAFGLPIIALLLFYRLVAENYVIWVLPFAAILVAGDRRSRIVYWGICLIAFVSSVVDSLLPYYFLPLAPWIGSYLVAAVSVVAPYRVAPGGVIVQGVTIGKMILSLLGVAASTLLAVLGVRLSKLSNLTSWTFSLTGMKGISRVLQSVVVDWGPSLAKKATVNLRGFERWLLRGVRWA